MAGSLTTTYQFVDISTNLAATVLPGNAAIFFNATLATPFAIGQSIAAVLDSTLTRLSNSTGTAIDGDSDGTPGGAYSYWFNATNAGDNTLFVDRIAATGGTGTLAKPFNTISAALTAAQSDSTLGKHDIVRIVGNNTANDYDDAIWVVNSSGTPLTGANLTDGQTFTVSDGQTTVTFEFDNNAAVAAGHVAVPFTAVDSATTIATSIAAAINNPAYLNAAGAAWPTR